MADSGMTAVKTGQPLGEATERGADGLYLRSPKGGRAGGILAWKMYSFPPPAILLGGLGWPQAPLTRQGR